MIFHFVRLNRLTILDFFYIFNTHFLENHRKVVNRGFIQRSSWRIMIKLTL